MKLMDLIRRADSIPARLAVFPGTFNPPTCAHLALAEAALGRVEEVVFVLPRAFPHKGYEGATFEQRLRLLREAVSANPRFSVASSAGGLFIDIAREVRQHYPSPTELLFLCGRDAAERIVHWDYGEPGAFARMLQEFGLLVARRGDEYSPPAELASRIHPLPVGCEWDEVSATEVRVRLAAGKDWRHLVPAGIVPLVSEYYR